MEDFSKYNGEGTTLRRAQLRMLDILIEFDKICKKHNIPYWLDGGTLLGAVRHGGFIPWDDDLDIAMSIKDFKKFKDIAPKELPSQFVYQDEDTDPKYYLKFAKIRDTKSFFYDPLGRDVKEKGIYIDIFPHEAMPSKRWQKFINYTYGNAFRRAKGFYDSKWKTFTGIILMPFAKILVAVCRLFFRFANQKFLFPACGVPDYPNAIKLKDDILPVKEILFEGYEFFAPNNPHGYLVGIYGDYMQLPPEDKRHPEHAEHIEFYD